MVKETSKALLILLENTDQFMKQSKQKHYYTFSSNIYKKNFPQDQLTNQKLNLRQIYTLFLKSFTCKTTGQNEYVITSYFISNQEPQTTDQKLKLKKYNSYKLKTNLQ